MGPGKRAKTGFADKAGVICSTGTRRKPLGSALLSSGRFKNGPYRQQTGPTDLRSRRFTRQPGFMLPSKGKIPGKASKLPAIKEIFL